MGNHYEIYRKSGKFMPIPSKTESIQTLSVKDRIYNVVCEWIITGVLKSGEKILIQSWPNILMLAAPL